jgi:hypothetical protein
MGVDFGAMAAAEGAPQICRYLENCRAVLPPSIDAAYAARTGNLLWRYCRLLPDHRGDFSEFPDGLMEKSAEGSTLIEWNHDFFCRRRARAGITKRILLRSYYVETWREAQPCEFTGVRGSSLE